MDLKDDDKFIKYREQPNITSRYFESNAGHLFVNNVNPFNSVGGNAGDVKENYTHKRKNEDDIYENTPIKELNITPSQELVNELINNYPFTNNRYQNEQYDEIQEALIADTQRLYSQPTISISSDICNAQYVSCSRDMYKTQHNDLQVKFRQYNQNNRAFFTNEAEADNKAERNGRCEKTTYCRPLINMYNQEFVYKTMQRNARLQNLVKKLVQARENEKQREAWNNYINELKNKHRYYSNEPSRISPQYVPGEHNSAETIDDFYNTRYEWTHSNPCQRLLQDLYNENYHVPPSTYNRYTDYDNNRDPDSGHYNYNSNRFCYPTSSQACISRWNKLRQNNQFAREWRSRPPGRYFRGNTIVIEKERKNMFDRMQGSNRPQIHYPRSTKSYICKNKMYNTIRSSSIPVQTENIPIVLEEDYKAMNALQNKNTEDNKGIYFPFKRPPMKDMQINVPSKQDTTKNKTAIPKVTSELLPYNKNDYENKRETFNEQYQEVTNNITKLKSKIRQSEEDTRLKSLANIEEKIDNLMYSINTIMADIQAKKTALVNRKNTAVSCTFVTGCNNLDRKHKSDPYNIINKNEEYLCGVMRSSSKSLAISEIELRTHREPSVSRIDKILLEEMKKSNKVKRDIEELLNLRNDRNCSVQITFEIPTKERSTEVTDSLSKARLESKTKNHIIVEELPTQTSERRGRQMTIAVNTDPLGLLALLRVSTETMKQLLSYMPNLNYNSYLSLLQLPKSGRCVSQYICNICGAAFGRPSQLSDHIEQHNLGRTRNCCICRHTLDVHRTNAGLFACQHCGQRFTRAYCCELHEQSCARQLGRQHDVTSSHMLLH